MKKKIGIWRNPGAGGGFENNRSSEEYEMERQTGHVASRPVCIFVQRLLVMARVAVGSERKEEEECQEGGCA